MAPQTLEGTPRGGVSRSGFVPARRDNIDQAWQDPRGLIAVDVLRRLMTTGAEAFFPQGPAGESAYYRATAFWPVSHDDDERLYPFFRAELGGSVRVCTSQVFFRRGDMFAGIAWERARARDRERVVKNATPIKTLADCNGNEQAWLNHWQDDHGVPPRVAEQLGRASNYVRNVCTLSCLGVASAYGDIVFCIDSQLVDGFSRSRLTEYARKNFDEQAPFGALMTRLQERVEAHRSFSGWFASEFPFVRAATVATVIAPVASGLWEPALSPLLKSMGDDAAVRFIANYGIFAAPLTLAALGVIFVRSSDRMSSLVNPPFRRRLQAFMDNCAHFLLWELLIWLALALGRLRAEPGDGNQSWMSTVSAVSPWIHISLTVLSAYCLFSAYCAVMPERQGAHEGASPGPTKLELFGFVAAFLSGALLLMAKHPDVGMAIPALLGAVAFCLLTGRLDTTSLGTPRWVVTLLYVNAVTRGALALAPTAWAPTLCTLRLPLDLLLLAVVSWAIRGCALERSLLIAEKHRRYLS